MSVYKGQIINCNRCGVVFRRTDSPSCPGCSAETKEEVHRVYRYVSEHPNETLKKIATQCGLPLNQLEVLFYAGSLGAAGASIRTHCHQCGVELISIRRKGRFCIDCADKVEEATIVSVYNKPQTHRTQGRLTNPKTTEEDREELSNLPERKTSFGFIRKI